MSSMAIQGGLSENDIDATLSRLDRDCGTGPDAAVLLVAGDPLGIVWANAAAISFYDETDLAVLSRRLFPEGQRGGLAAALRRLREGAPRLERHRILVRSNARHLTLTVQRSRALDGTPLWAIVGPGGDPVLAHEVPAPTPAIAAALGAFAADARPAVAPASDPADAPEGASARPFRDRLATRSHRFFWRTDDEGRITSLGNGHPTCWAWSTTSSWDRTSLR